jgi:hypothetical protein
VNAEDDVGVHSFYLLTRQAFTAVGDWKLIQDFTLPAELMEQVAEQGSEILPD